jgi:hypothetical protein
MFHRTHAPTHPPRGQTATEHLQRDENRSKSFVPQKASKNPIMMSRDAISLTRFRALGGPTQERLNRSSFIRAYFRIRRYMTLEARITSNFLEPSDAEARPQGTGSGRASNGSPPIARNGRELCLPHNLGIARPWPRRRHAQRDPFPRWSASATAPASPAPRPSGKCSTITRRSCPASPEKPPARSTLSSIAATSTPASPACTAPTAVTNSFARFPAKVFARRENLRRRPAALSALLRPAAAHRRRRDESRNRGRPCAARPPPARRRAGCPQR